jgi:hypothetical protein
LPVFASDALSSVAYAPDEILLTLSLAGLAAYAFSWKIAIVVALVMLVVVASYRQNVHAYPSGGGDYEVATVNLGPTAGLTVASALLVDYVLTVAVSISSGVQNAKSVLPFIDGHEGLIAAGATLLLMALNLRGVRESGNLFAIPVVTLANLTNLRLIDTGLSHYTPRRQAGGGGRGNRDRPARRGRILRLPTGVLLRRGRHDDHLVPGRQHRVQRLPGAGIDPGAGRLPPSAVAYPR